LDGPDEASNSVNFVDSCQRNRYKSL
jgi:hypothetical protein